MSRFTEYQAFKKLQQQSNAPINLTEPGQLTPERLEHFKVSACGYTLFYGTELVTDQVMNDLFSLAEEAQALIKMQDMQNGKIINTIHGFPSEDRAVLHTATRDFFDNQITTPSTQEARKLAYQETEKLKDFLAKIDASGKFNDIIMVGIGGSDLGPRAQYLALQPLLKKNRRAHFICNVDPDDAALTLKGIDLEHALVVIVSKTGTTIETATNEAIVRSHFLAKKLKPQDHFVSVSMPGSPLDDPKEFLECFYIWDWVGGRYSSTSMVGGVVIGFSFGFDVYWEFLHGANAMDKVALTAVPEENLPLIGALLGIWNRNFLKHPTLAIIPYSQALLRYPAHVQQLDMESNGKRIDKEGNPVDFETGPIIWGEPGTNAQHSFYQLIHQGTTVVPLELIGYKHCQSKEDIVFKGTKSQQKLIANLFAQMIALALGQTDENPNKVFPGNRPSHLLLGYQLTPFALGALLAYFEHKVAFQGFIWNINSFDQEGVQLGKVLANKVLKRLAEPNGLQFPLADVLIDHLNAMR